MKLVPNGLFSFPYLLLEYYKELNLNEKETLVLLMVDHLLEEGNDFITSDTLSLKMNYSLNEIDMILANLVAKNYIEFVSEKETTTLSLNPIKKKLAFCFKQTIFSEEEVLQNKEIEEKRERIFNQFLEIFERNLSPVEVDRIDSWIRDEVDEDIIIDSLKDAKMRHKLSINYIDKLVINRLKEEDNSGNDIRRKK